MDKLLDDLQNPHYVSTLYNIERQEGEPFIRRGAGVKTFFSAAPCNKQLINVDFKISSFNLKEKQQKLIKST